MTDLTWGEVLSKYEAEIYDLCLRVVACARLQDELARIAVDLTAGRITTDEAIERAEEAAADVDMATGKDTP